MTPDELREQWPEVEKNLQPADIFLVHARKGYLSKKIQKTGNSYWNHTGLIFMDKESLPFGGPLIVEAAYTGIEIHQMKKYSDQFEKYDIGVLRYPELSDKQREEIIMGFILSNLDVNYDYSRLTGFFLGPMIKKLSTKLWSKTFKSVTHQDAFICTTFVHKAFHDLSKHRKGGGFVETHDHVLREMQAEEFVMPGDIAKEPIFEWVFNKHD